MRVRQIATAVMAMALLHSTFSSADPLSEGIISADGFGTVDSSQARNRVQAKLLARRAAIVDAQRNLLEVLEGVRVTSGTTVKDAQLESDLIANRVKGLLKNYFTLNESTTEEDGTWLAEVRLGVCVNRASDSCTKRQTLTEALFDQLDKAGPDARYQGTAPGPNATSYTGLVVDLTTSDFVPLLDARVVDPGGKEVYGPGHYKGRQGDWLHWSTSMSEAAANNEVIGGRPLVVVADASEDSGIVLNAADAERVFSANIAGNNFLGAGRVILVTN